MDIKKLFIHWIFDVSEHLSFRKKQVCLPAVEYGFQVFRLSEIASAEASPGLSWQVPDHFSTDSQNMPLPILNARVSLLVWP
jgi:hypothetical protein